MRKGEIEPHGVYEGKPQRGGPGEQRMVLLLTGNEVRFRVVTNPNPSWGFDWKVGSTHQVFAQNFARWAMKRII